MNTWTAGKDSMKHHYLIKNPFYSELNLVDITEKDYRHAQNVCRELKLKNQNDYYDLYIYTLLLVFDVFVNFRNKCIVMYKFDPAHILSAIGLARQTCLKKTVLELKLLTNTDMLLMAKKGTRGGICYAIHTCAKVNIKYMKNYDKTIE